MCNVLQIDFCYVFVYVPRWVTQIHALTRCSLSYCRLLWSSYWKVFFTKKGNLNDENVALCSKKLTMLYMEMYENALRVFASNQTMRPLKIHSSSSQLIPLPSKAYQKSKSRAILPENINNDVTVYWWFWGRTPMDFPKLVLPLFSLQIFLKTGCSVWIIYGLP